MVFIIRMTFQYCLSANLFHNYILCFYFFFARIKYLKSIFVQVFCQPEVCIPCVYLVLAEARGCQVFGTKIRYRFWAATWVLRTEPGFSGKQLVCSSLCSNFHNPQIKSTINSIIKAVQYSISDNILTCSHKVYFHIFGLLFLYAFMLQSSVILFQLEALYLAFLISFPKLLFRCGNLHFSSVFEGWFYWIKNIWKKFWSVKISQYN